MEDRSVPAVVVYSNTFDWNNVADVVVTVTYDAPSHPGLYLWNYHVTNESFGSGIGVFAVPAEDSGMVFNLGNSVGWTGSVGTLMGNSDLVSWQSGGPTLGIGNSADFWFTTIPVDLALTNGIISNPGLTQIPGGLFVVPTAAARAPLPPQPLPHPAILVATDLDKYEPDVGLTSLREAIDYVNFNAPLLEHQVRFSAGMEKTIELSGDTLALRKDIWINGTGRNITITKSFVSTANGLFELDPNKTAVFEALTLTGGSRTETQELTGGAIRSFGNLVVRSCYIHHNFADDGGGIAALSGTLQILNSDIFNNEATGMGPKGLGGGVYIGGWVTGVEIANSLIHHNMSTNKGGGVYIVGGNTAASINTTVILNASWLFFNESVNRGGGLAVGTDASPQLLIGNNTLIEYNTATAANSKGGGMYLGAGTAHFAGATIARNSANSGGGLYVVLGASVESVPGGLFIFDNTLDDSAEGAA